MTTAPIINWWRRQRLTTPRYPQLTYYQARSEAPAKIRPRTIAVIGTADRPKWAIFDCPCGRGHEIALSLQASHNPHWRLDRSSGAPTLFPSVDSARTYRCHFFLREGRVEWVMD